MLNAFTEAILHSKISLEPHLDVSVQDSSAVYLHFSSTHSHSPAVPQTEASVPLHFSGVPVCVQIPVACSALLGKRHSSSSGHCPPFSVQTVLLLLQCPTKLPSQEA